MSIHLLECAAQLKLQASTKLALMAFADSADRYTHVAFPGLDQVQTWAGVGRSRAAELVAELSELGLLRKHKAGHRGRRAEYIVFPEGCCEAHQRPGVQDVVDVEFSTGKGSTGPDSLSVNGSTPVDPFTGDVHTVIPSPPESLHSTGPITQKGSGLGPAQWTPSLTPSTTPLTPASGGASCARHPNTRGANCRACGSTSRQLIDAERKARKDATRRTEQARLAAEAEKLRAATVSSSAVADLLADTRGAIAANRLQQKGA